MGKKLVIVESPAKAKTIAKILGDEYVVMSSKGNVRDLPEKKLGVDLKNGFRPTYEIIPARKDTVNQLRLAAKDCTEIYLATDPDREGEAIAWHLKALLSVGGSKGVFHRVTYNEVTPKAVQEAIAHPRNIDLQRVNAQQARRILDRIVGFKVSPFLSKKLRGNLSAGRVQSPALRLVCEREEAIEAFEPREYWSVVAVLEGSASPPFEAKLVQDGDAEIAISDEAHAVAIVEELRKQGFRLADVRRSERRVNPKPPFITSSLQQEAARKLGFSPRRTMSLAQRLYEGVEMGGEVTGLITYMRTDSVRVAEDAISAVRELIQNCYGQEALPEAPVIHKSKKGAQEAHEAIRPSSVAKTPESLKDILEADAWKLYDLIWKRFVASQMKPAVYDQTAFDIEAGRFLLRATGRVMRFPGFTSVYLEAEDEDAAKNEDEENRSLPLFQKGDDLRLVELKPSQHFTKPKPRFTEASLVKELEENGVGRPSTYASILSTLREREYVTKENGALKPESLGRQVNSLLVKHWGALFDIGFTAGMEKNLDKVEHGAVSWTAMLEEFNRQFQQWMKVANPPADPAKAERLFAALGKVRQWRPPATKGKKTYDDEKFMKDLRKQQRDGMKPLSQLQFEALAKLSLRYVKQVPEIKTILDELGFEDILNANSAAVRKIEALKGVEFTAPLSGKKSDGEFVESLKELTEEGVILSAKQILRLDRMLIRYQAQIANYEEIKNLIDFEAVQPGGPDSESEGLFVQLASVTNWEPPHTSKKGEERDDKTFYQSLKEQFETNKWLSLDQRKHLRILVKKYCSS